MARSLEQCLIPELPGGAWYVSDFVSEREEAHLLHKFYASPVTAFRQLARRRLQVYPAALDPSSNVLASGPLPAWIEQPLVSRLLALQAQNQSVFATSPHHRPVHALVNEYPAGVGIAPHEDGPAYFPFVTTISVGSHTVLELYPKLNPEGTEAAQPAPESTKPPHSGQARDASTEEKSSYSSSVSRTAQWRVLLEPRSLLVLGEGVYTGFLHGIDEVETDLDLYGPELTRNNHERVDTPAAPVVNWSLLAPATRALLAAEQGRWTRQTRVSITLRDVWRQRNFERILPGWRGRGR